MNREFEDQLRTLFSESRQELPDNEFLPRLRDDMRRRRRTQNLMWILGSILMLVSAWALGPLLQEGALMAATWVFALAHVAPEVVATTSRSALVYIYAGSLGAYLLVRALRRFDIRIA